MRYTQKDIRKVMGIGRDALRLYEQRGIIAPEVDPANGYRYYDDWQVNLLWEIKRYQGLGFSLAEIRTIQQTDTLDSLIDRVRVRREELAAELVRLTAVEKSCAAYLESLEDLPLKPGEFRVARIPELAYVPEREVHDLLLDSTDSAITRFMNDHADLTTPICWFPDMRQRTYYWGFGLPSTQYAELGGPREGRLPVLLAGGRALVTCIDAGERGRFGQYLFSGLIEEAKRMGETPCGMLFGRLLARTHEADGYHRFVEGILPLAKKDDGQGKACRCE